ncbi:hypothetical protein ACFL57_03635 [Candidatus Margulisiibacteriota bacterium]
MYEKGLSMPLTGPVRILLLIMIAGICQLPAYTAKSMPRHVLKSEKPDTTVIESTLPRIVAGKEEMHEITSPKAWDVSIGGFLNDDGKPVLKKEQNDQAKWNSILRLAPHHNISRFVGKTLHFFTVTGGDPSVRLAPNFFIDKGSKRYYIWWDTSKMSPDKISRKYLAFASDSDGLIIGKVHIPDVYSDNNYYYAVVSNGQKPFLVRESTEITLTDIKAELSTDWQHDIPGAYQLNAKQSFPGRYGEVVFERFYMGLQKAVPVLDADRDIWLKSLPLQEMAILRQEFSLPLEYASEKLQSYKYIVAAGKMKKTKEYYQANKHRFSSDYYYLTKNYFPWSQVMQHFRVINKDNETNCYTQDRQVIIEKKKNPDTWTIVKIGEINDADIIKELKGQVVRLKSEIEAEGISKGYFNWQTVLIDIAQLDKNNNEIGIDDDLRLPVSSYSGETNYTGVFENEFIINNNTRRIEISLKIAGTSDSVRKKPGMTLDKLIIRNTALAKTSAAFNADKMFRSLPEKPVETTQKNGKRYLVFNNSGTGLLIGDRSFSIKRSAGDVSIEYDIKNSQSYNGLYSSIFDISKMEELELAAEMGGKLIKHGNPPNWATSIIEIHYYDENGKRVYPADSGAERYQNIMYSPDKSKVIQKSFFHIPHERGARYAQIKMHFIREYIEETNLFDNENYFTGKSYASRIILRPSLKIENPYNIAPYNGTFYKHKNGRSLSWNMDGSKIVEDLKAQTRKIVFENTDKSWSSLKTDLVIPKEAVALRGLLNIDIQEIKTGLEQWKGFGLFLEADVIDSEGNEYHYGGIPVFKREGNRLVRMERIPVKYKGRFEYYIPLYHENLRINKLTWQLALAGTGRVVLNPIEPGPNSSIIKIEFLGDKDIPDNPAFWPQYSLYATDGKRISFQKHYQLEIDKQKHFYDSAESLNDHLAGYLQRKIDVTGILKNLDVDAETVLFGAKIKAVPSYARVSREYKTSSDTSWVHLKFKLSGNGKDDRFNLKPLLIDSAENVLEVPFFLKAPSGGWKKVPSHQDVFPLEHGQYEALVPARQLSFAPEKIRLIIGDNQGQIEYSDMRISMVNKAINESDLRNGLTIKDNELKPAYRQASIQDFSFSILKNKNKGFLDHRELAALDQTKPVVPLININDYPALKKQDNKIRAAIKENKVNLNKGRWYYGPEKHFQQVGFTIVGETFNKWYELRRDEFKAKDRVPYWAAYLNAAERGKLKKITGVNDYIKMFVRSQSRIWQRAGVNTIRVHQLFAGWSGLDKKEIGLTVSILRMLQKEEGFLIIFDLLPNPDFTGSIFAETLKSKPYAKDISETSLFKAVLILPEVRDGYVKPAIREIIKVFKENDFWPNSVSYCNETNLVHGYWHIDKNNPNAHPYFCNLYHYYYEQYLKQLPSFPPIRSFIDDAYPMLQLHIQSAGLKSLNTDLTTLTEMIKAKKRIKDNASFVYYNLLRGDVINQYSAYSKELQLVKDSFKNLVQQPATLRYYLQVDKEVEAIEEKIEILTKAIEQKQKKNAEKLLTVVRDKKLHSALNKLQISVLKKQMPANYQIPDKLNFFYIDSFGELSRQQRDQAFFTSFMLPVVFTEEINVILQENAPHQNFGAGLNNDYIRDGYALLANAYLYTSIDYSELRFNKYTHHPVGGHTMLLHPGQGNVFDVDSNIDLNLDIFNPAAPAGYPVRLSETNYTFAGDDRAGQGNWTVLDYLKTISKGNHLLYFQMGPNNLDKPVISDYFNIGNRPFKTSALNLVAIAALARTIDEGYINVSDFKYKRFQQMIDLNGRELFALAGVFNPQKTVANKDQQLTFTYTGQREQTDMAIIGFRIGEDILIHLYGIERNSNQRNRPTNPNIVKSYGSAPILYQVPKGLLSVKLNGKTEPVKIIGFTPSGKKTTIPEQAYKIENGVLTINTSLAGEGIISYKVI